MNKSDKDVSDKNKAELFVLTVSQGCIRSIPLGYPAQGYARDGIGVGTAACFADFLIV